MSASYAILPTYARALNKPKTMEERWQTKASALQVSISTKDRIAHFMTITHLITAIALGITGIVFTVKSISPGHVTGLYVGSILNIFFLAIGYLSQRKNHLRVAPELLKRNGVMQLRSDLLKNPPTLNCPTQAVAMGVLSEEVYDKLQTLTREEGRIESIKNNYRDLSKEVIENNSVYTEMKSDYTSQRKEWDAQWAEFRSELEADLPNPVEELNLD